MPDTQGKKERITIYAPPHIITIIDKIIEKGIQVNKSETVCMAVLEYWKNLQNDEDTSETDQRLSDIVAEMGEMRATIDLLTHRLATVEQKYSLMVRTAVADHEREYDRKKT